MEIAGLSIIKTCEFAVIFFCCDIMRVSGVGFGVETAEPDFFAAGGDSGDPFSGMFFKEDADEMRRCFSCSFFLVALVL